MTTNDHFKTLVRSMNIVKSTGPAAGVILGFLHRNDSTPVIFLWMATPYVLGIAVTMILAKRLQCPSCHESLVQKLWVKPDGIPIHHCPKCGADLDAPLPDTPFK